VTGPVVAQVGTWERAMLRAGEHLREAHRPPVWVARFMRFHRPDEEECDSLEEAIHFLWWGEGQNYLSGTEIVGPDGQLVDVSWGESPW
jgi:hypothetical protein